MTVEKDLEQLQTQAPGTRLGRRGLTLLLLSVLSAPILGVLLLYAFLPKAQDRPLAVTVAPVESSEGEQAVQITNAGEDELRALSVEINDAFFYLPQQPLARGQSVTLPLSWFAKKSGHHFDPAMPLESVRVSARLPGNERGLMFEKFAK